MVSTQMYDLPNGQGCKLAYRLHNPKASEGGAGVPLVLINGLSAVMQDWSPLVEELAKKRTVLISDHRGIGASTTSDEWDGELTLESMGLDVLSLCVSLGWKQVDLLGFSMGGHITQAIISSPDFATEDTQSGGVRISLSNSSIRIRKVVLTATMVKLPRGDLDLMSLQAQAKALPDKKARDTFITSEMMKMQYHPEVLGPNKALQSKLEQRIDVALSTSRPASIIAQQFFAIQGGDLRDQLSNVPASLPVMVIHGQRDRMVHYAESNHITDKIKHARRLANTPSDQFAHFWYDYFTIDFWRDSINNFLDNGVVGGHNPSKL